MDALTDGRRPWRRTGPTQNSGPTSRECVDFGFSCSLSYPRGANASKSFLQSFAVALQSELKGTGVTITSLMPGPTETNFFHRADMDDTRIGQASKDDPAEVAKQGFERWCKARTGW